MAKKRSPSPKSPAATPVPASANARDWLIALAIAFATVLLYSDVARHEFVNYDDPYYVTENPHVSGGLSWAGVRWAFTSFEDGNWFPLTWLSHMVDVSIWGVSSGPHHVTNVVLHAVTAILLYFLFRRLSLPCTPSATGALLFALHPLRVESVAWLAERKDVLSGMLAVLTLVLYVGYTRPPGAGRYAGVVAAFAASLMAKAMPVTLPIVMLLLDVLALGRRRTESWMALVREKAPFVALSASAAVVAIIAQTQAGATTSLARIPLGDRLGNAAVSYVMYLVDTVWPFGLAIFYPRPPVVPWRIAIAGLVLATLTWMAWRWRSRHPSVTLGWCWYLVMLLPVSGLVQIGAQARADRYTYLPSIGLCLAAAYGLATFEARLPRLRSLARGVALVLVMTLAALTFIQVQYWRDSVTLFAHAKQVTRPNYTVLNNLGEALATRGDISRAAEVFSEAVEVAPGNPAARLNLANALNRAGRVAQAVSEYREAIRLQPSSAAAYAGLGAVLGRLGAVDESVAALRMATQLDPSQPDPHYNLGNLLAGLGRFDEAVSSLAEAVRLRPGDAMARSNLGAALASLGRYDEAIEQFAEALRINPELQQTRANRDRTIELKKSRGRE